MARGFTLLEILVVVAVIGILAAISIPVYLRSRVAGYEAGAMGTLHAISEAQANFATDCGGYAPTLARLAARGYIQPALAETGEWSGYQLWVEPNQAPDTAPGLSTCEGEIVLSNYFAGASPLLRGTTGEKYFATDGLGAGAIAESREPVPNPIPPGMYAR